MDSSFMCQVLSLAAYTGSEFWVEDFGFTVLCSWCQRSSTVLAWSRRAK